MTSIRKATSRICIYLAVLALLPFSAPQLHAQSEEVEQVRQAIKARGARWHADETSMSKLTREEKRKRLGNREDDDLLAEFLSSNETAPIPQVEGSPATLDWRNVAGFTYVSPVKNQGSCGSCWAFATTAALESQVMIATAGTQVDLSEQALVSCSGTGSCSGGSSASASTFLRDVGIPLESCFAYTATNNSCSNACMNWQENTFKINGWHRASPTTLTVEDLKKALYGYGPVVVTMYVYNDFYSYRSGVYSYTSGSYVGAHAVLAVGYDDAKQAFLVKNSWGSGWGESGFFWIAYSEVGGTSRFGYSTMVYDGYADSDPKPQPDPEPEPDPTPDPAPDPTPDPIPDPKPCSYSLSSTSSPTFKPEGGKGSFVLYARGVCSVSSFAPVSSASWVAVASTKSVNGGLQVNYVVSSNTGAARSAAIIAGGLKHTINQQKSNATNNGKGNKVQK